MAKKPATTRKWASTILCKGAEQSPAQHRSKSCESGPPGKTGRWPQRPQRKARRQRPQPHLICPPEASTAVRAGTRVGRTAEEASATRAKRLEKATSCLVPGSSTELTDRYKKPNKTTQGPPESLKGPSSLGSRIRYGDLRQYKNPPR